MGRKNYSCYEYSETERNNFEDLYEKTFPSDKEFFANGKDLVNNTTTKIRVAKINSESGLVLAETPFGQTIVIDIKKEEKGFKKLGYPMYEIQVGQELDVIISRNSSGSFTGSLSAGYEKTLKNELHKAIKNEDCAYSVRIVSVCNGGFMVDLSGVQCFLPGSLAAANRIMNFNDYVGRNINVMVEIYDQKRDIFVVSFKKYLKKIIDSEVKNLSFSSKYKGVVTGSSPSGVFVEWDELFTGIIQFEESTLPSIRNLKQGETVEFYVTDIKNPSRILLSTTSPNIKLKNIQELKESSSEVVGEKKDLRIYKAEVTKMKTFGLFVKLDNGLAGLIEKEKLVNSIDKYKIGQLVNCFVSSVDTSTLKVQLTEVK